MKHNFFDTPQTLELLSVLAQSQSVNTLTDVNLEYGIGLLENEDDEQFVALKKFLIKAKKLTHINVRQWIEDDGGEESLELVFNEILSEISDDITIADKKFQASKQITIVKRDSL